MAGRSDIPAGLRVRVVQKLRVQDTVWCAEVQGVVVAYRHESTGSWYAHGKDGKYWLNRLRLRKDDGELTALVLDDSSVVSRLVSGGSAPADGAVSG